jgi:hypothetical protein
VALPRRGAERREHRRGAPLDRVVDHAGPDVEKKIGELAAALPIDLARRRSRSLDEFISALEALAPANAPARRTAARLRAALVGIQPADRAAV